MNNIVTVAGATGQLGQRVALALARRGASVRALLRSTSSHRGHEALLRAGADVRSVSFEDGPGLTEAVRGSSCVVSALSGLADVIVDAQTNLLGAVEAAEVPRFMPSDFSCDLTKVPPGENRNFDLRRTFHDVLAKSPVRATSILNGAFADMLAWTRSPLYDFARCRVAYWGSPDQRLDFTAMDDVGEFTAAAALDAAAPRFLRIAGNEASARDLAGIARDVFGAPYELACEGALSELADRIRAVRAADPASEASVFPPFQGMQYLHNMFTGQGKLLSLDNDRYPEIRWTSVRELLQQRKSSTQAEV
ncbi:NmrA family NAD(P)-binding protein [Xanthomonas hyacinthi]|nr:NmrA family NAD(P)-binding protein [Xanthomonas hyacinthi]